MRHAGEGLGQEFERICLGQPGQKRIAVQIGPAGFVEHRNPLQISPLGMVGQSFGKSSQPTQQRTLPPSAAEAMHEPVVQHRPHPTRQTIEPRSQPHCPITQIPGKQLVATVARECHCDVLARKLRNVIGRNRRTVCEWFVVVPGQLFEDFDSARLDAKLVMVRAQARRNLPGITRFVELADRKADRKGLYRLVGQPLHESHHERRVDTAGKKRPQWHVRFQSQSHRRGQ